MLYFKQKWVPVLPDPIPNRFQRQARLLKEIIMEWEFGPSREKRRFFCGGALLSSGSGVFKAVPTESYFEEGLYGEFPDPLTCTTGTCGESIAAITKIFQVEPIALQTLPFIRMEIVRNSVVHVRISLPLLHIAAESGLIAAWKARLAVPGSR